MNTISKNSQLLVFIHKTNQKLINNTLTLLKYFEK